jgi:hypothetical protein
LPHDAEDDVGAKIDKMLEAAGGTSPTCRRFGVKFMSRGWVPRASTVMPTTGCGRECGALELDFSGYRVSSNLRYSGFGSLGVNPRAGGRHRGEDA